jgi:hypothetical protein
MSVSTDVRGCAVGVKVPGWHSCHMLHAAESGGGRVVHTSSHMHLTISSRPSHTHTSSQRMSLMWCASYLLPICILFLQPHRHTTRVPTRVRVERASPPPPHISLTHALPHTLTHHLSPTHPSLTPPCNEKLLLTPHAPTAEMPLSPHTKLFLSLSLSQLSPNTHTKDSLPLHTLSEPHTPTRLRLRRTSLTTGSPTLTVVNTCLTALIH